MSRSDSSREVRLHDQDGLDRTLSCESTYRACTVCPVHEMTVKKKRVETFRYPVGCIILLSLGRA